jgi:predicted AlkP superfamily phosphohydrolase/phosphomutase
MVSDRFLYDRWALATRTRGIPYETSGSLVSPPEAEARLRSFVVPLTAVTAKDLERFIHGAVTPHAGLTLHDAEDELRIVYAKDESVIRMTRALLEEKVPRLLAAYIEGTDIASHYFWKYRFTDDWNRRYPNEKVPQEEIERYGGVIDAYYRLQDRNLATLLRFADADTTIIVCSDHGFVTGKRPPGTPGAARTVSGVHEETGPPGILILSGSGIRSGAHLQGASIYDVAPTVLTLLGLPAEPGMDGRVLDGALDAAR